MHVLPFTLIVLSSSFIALILLTPAAEWACREEENSTNHSYNNENNNDMNTNSDIINKSFLYDNMLGVRKREYEEAVSALKAEKRALDSLPTEQAEYARADEAVKDIINARKRAPKLRRRAELMGSVAEYASPHVGARRGPRLSLLKQANELEAAAVEAAEYLGVSTDAHKQALIEAAHARLDQLRAEVKARRERIRTLRHVAHQAEENLRSAAEDVLNIKGVNAFTLSDNGVPSHVLEGLF